jgi:hypothetical protein
MKIKVKVTYAIVISLLLLTGYDKKGLFEVIIVSTSLNKPNHTLNYDVKLKISNCNELCKKNLNLQVVPGRELKNFMITEGKNKLFLTNYSKHFYGNSAKFHLEYKIKDKVKISEIMYFSKCGTLLVIDGTKVIEKVPLKKFKGNYD